MANILSQDEVDALMGAMERGDLDALEEEASGQTHVLAYNFRKPHYITKEQLRGLTTIHEKFARELQTELSLLMRANATVKLVSTEQQQYGEFIRYLSEISHLVLFTADPLPGISVLEINLALVYGFVDLLLGGKGSVETAIRNLTEVEMGVAKHPIERALNVLEASWQSSLKIKICTERIESNPESAHAAPLDAPVVVVRLDARVGQANGIINLCYPLPLVLALIDELQGRSGRLDSYYGVSDPAGIRKQMMRALLDVPLTISADLGKSVISGRDLLSLDKGDIIVLDSRVSDTTRVSVEGQPIFDARTGRVKENLGIKLNGWLKKAENDKIRDIV